MKVLHVISGNDYGGGAAYVLNICKAPAEKFDNYLCCVGEGPLYKMAEEKGIKIIKLSVKSILKAELAKFICEKSIDIVNFHGAKANFLYFFIKKTIAIPTTVTVHSDYRYDFTNSRIKQLLFTPLSVLGLRSFKNYVCVSEHVAHILSSNNFKGNMRIIENGIDIKDTYITEKEQAIRNKYGISKEEFVFLMVARMHPIKNHKTLIRAFKRLKEEYENIKLMLVGDGPLLQELKEEVKKLNIDKYVIFTNVQPNSFDFFNVCNISLLTSFSEGGSPPLAILESGTMKKTVICSNIGDIGKTIDKGCGYLIQPNCEEDIYSKMKASLNNKEKLQLMGENLYKVVAEQYSIEIFWEKYYNFYEDILKNKQ